MNHIEKIQEALIILMHEDDEAISIHFNPQSVYYDSVEKAILEAQNHPNNQSTIAYHWVSEKDKTIAMENGQLWCIHHYDKNWREISVEKDKANRVGLINKRLVESSFNAATLPSLLNYYPSFKSELEIIDTINQLEYGLLRLLNGKHANLEIRIGKILSEEEKNDLIKNRDWVDKKLVEELQVNDVIWSMTVYPNTPVGYYKIITKSLRACLDYLEIIAEIDPSLTLNKKPKL